MGVELKFTTTETFKENMVIEEFFINGKPIDKKSYDLLRDNYFDELYKKTKTKSGKNNIKIEEAPVSKDDDIVKGIALEEIYDEEISTFLDVLGELERQDQIIMMMNFIDGLREDQHLYSTLDMLKEVKTQSIGLLNEFFNKSIKRISKRRLI